MSLPISKAFIAAVALAVVSVSPADAAQTRKGHKAMAAAPGAAAQKCRGANVYPCGPVVWNQHYFGDDPDPNIRFQLWRDFNSAFGGGND